MKTVILFLMVSAAVSFSAERVVESFPAGGTVNTLIEESGIYFVQLVTGSADIIKRRLAVIRCSGN